MEQGHDDPPSQGIGDRVQDRAQVHFLRFRMAFLVLCAVVFALLRGGNRREQRAA
ncbi:hypothetical protein [Streptomyces sp. Ncost-T10-10d]|uniref:hypothetical protein n=1 Tax=Streptomyces sp. Ncost-T10-10d TaxID=1839774 RepID=UPI00159EFF7F|nr:hypothetical protein [Streptomyces sp. Ncost-T10-10d]